MRSGLLAALRKPRRYLKTLAVCSLLVTEGCGSLAPCLEYQIVSQRKTSSFRGSGFIEYTDQTRICTRRGATVDDLVQAHLEADPAG